MWRQEIDTANAEACRMINGAIKSFAKKNEEVLMLAHLMHVTPKEEEDVSMFPMINGDRSIMLALLI